MWLTLLAPILSQIFGENGPIGQYLKTKADQAKAAEEYKLATLNAAIEQAKTDAKQVSDRLNSTSQYFKQSTFWFIALPVVITMFFPNFAATMWHNFTLVPEWFQILFVSVYSSIWGLPIAKEYLGGMFKSLGNALDARREYKLEKARINRDAVFTSLRKLFPRGFSQSQVDEINHALDAGEQ